MSDTAETPQWMTDAAQDARALLGIDDGWRIVLELSDAPGGDASNNASAACDPVYLNATIEVSPDLLEGDDGRRVILHEMLHVALSPLYRVLYLGTRHQAKAAKRALRDQYNDAEEQIIQRMSRAMLRQIKPVEEWDADANAPIAAA